MPDSDKPLGRKAYGSIPHIAGSRLGPGDHTCSNGQTAIVTVKTRDRFDHVTATVKLDGSCMSVARIDGRAVALNRAGYLAASSPREQHHLFAQWVEANQDRLIAPLEEGQRFVGEWLAQAHGTRYVIDNQPFIVFDAMVGATRLSSFTMSFMAAAADLPTAYTLSSGPAFSLKDAIAAIAIPRHGELDPVEGVVWRVERKGIFDFLCKWVRNDKVDGKYLPEISGQPAIWNWTQQY